MYQLHCFLTQLEFSKKVGRRNYYNLESTQIDENFLKNQQIINIFDCLIDLIKNLIL